MIICDNNTFIIDIYIILYEINILYERDME